MHNNILNICFLFKVKMASLVTEDKRVYKGKGASQESSAHRVQMDQRVNKDPKETMEKLENKVPVDPVAEIEHRTYLGITLSVIHKTVMLRFVPITMTSCGKGTPWCILLVLDRRMRKILVMRDRVFDLSGMHAWMKKI